LSAGNDLRVTGSQLEIAGSGRIEAGGSFTLEAGQEVETHSGLEVARGREETRESLQVSHVASQIQTGGDLEIVAGQDASVRGSVLEAGGVLAVTAGGNVNLVNELDVQSASQNGKESGESAVVETRLLSGREMWIEAGGE
jgi:filamentous hemagglutinin